MITPRHLRYYAYEIFTGKSLQRKRLQFIERYQFSNAIIQRFQLENNIDEDDIQEIIDTFKSYLMIFTGPDRKFCAMPSLIVDELWHTFILFTKEYFIFCKQAFGYYLHHSPNSSVYEEDLSNGGKNTYAALELLAFKYHNWFYDLTQYTGKDDFYAHIFYIDFKFPMAKSISH